MYTQRVVLALLIAGVVVSVAPPGFVEARGGGGPWQERVRDTFEHARERIQERQEKVVEKMTERIERVQTQVERAKKQAQERTGACRDCDTPSPDPTPEPDPIPEPEPEPDPDPVEVLPIVTLSASRMAVVENGTSTLTWTGEFAEYCVAEGAIDWEGAVATSGTRMVTLVATTTYILACGNEYGSTTAEVEVVVVETPNDPGADPRPEPTGDAPVVLFTATPSTVVESATSTLEWSSVDADVCIASGAPGWQGVVATSGVQEVVLSATTTYTLSCENMYGTTSVSVEVAVVSAPSPEPEPEPTPDPEPTTGKVLITEVLFNPGPTVAQGIDDHNEWIEIYNGTNAPIDMKGWGISDGVATDTIATSSLILPAGEYLIVTRYASTSNYWVFGPGTVVVYLNATLGSDGLTNAGESAILYDASGAMVDAVSWGTVTKTMSPSVSITGYVEGESIARKDRTVDTDTASDWEIASIPTPGA